MRILFDASALIHLIHGSLLDVILKLPEREWFVGPLVLSECEQEGVVPHEVQQAIDDQRISLLDDSDISGSDFLRFLQLYRLSAGETECLTFVATDVTSDFIICCDDRKARQMIVHELGEDRLTGSLGLLREAVAEGLLSVDEAMAGYRRMKAAGAFLPDVDQAFFQGG